MKNMKNTIITYVEQVDEFGVKQLDFLHDLLKQYNHVVFGNDSISGCLIIDAESSLSIL